MAISPFDHGFAHVEKSWTAMRPRSLREAMTGGQLTAQPL